MLWLVAVIVVVTGFLFYFRNQVYFSHGSDRDGQIFEIKKGEGNAEIASRLQQQGIVSGKVYFYYYLRTRGLSNKILPGNYQLSGDLTIPEVAIILTEQKNEFTKVTFPEGWTVQQMANRLTANGLPGEDFLQVAKNPPAELVAKFDFLATLPKETSLEGFLFPDTYFFSKEATGNGIVQKMLDNFGVKVSSKIPAGTKISELITLASIIEGEVRSEADKKMVSGIFWNRLENSQRLQSCATIAYVLGERKKQYSFEDTRVVSPYNTYLNAGLPPGPISNPGLVSVEAAMNPAETTFNYFLSDPETGQTIFSKTIEEHNANKVKYGL